MQSAHFAALPPSCRAAAQSQKLRAAQLRGCVGALVACRPRRCASRCLRAVCELGGEYVETYDDVDKRMLDYFTFRVRAAPLVHGGTILLWGYLSLTAPASQALRMSLAQLQETDTTPGKQEYTCVTPDQPWL